MENIANKPEPIIGEGHKLRSLIREVFDSEIKITWKSQTDALWLAEFTVDSILYQLKIEKDAEQIDGRSIYMIKFSWWDGNGWSKSLTKAGTAFRVFGALRQATVHFFDAVNPDIFLFVGDPSREGVYKRLLNLLAESKRDNYNHLGEEEMGKFIYVLLNKNIPNETTEKIKAWVKTI